MWFLKVFLALRFAVSLDLHFVVRWTVAGCERQVDRFHLVTARRFRANIWSQGALRTYNEVRDRKESAGGGLAQGTILIIEGLQFGSLKIFNVISDSLC